MRKVHFVLYLIPFLAFSQDYVDIFKLNYGFSPESHFKNSTDQTVINTLESKFTLPKPLSENQILITGIDFSLNQLRLFPGESYTNLFSTTAKIGWLSQWNDKWSSTLVLLPKISSEYKPLTSNDLYIGGLGILKIVSNKNLSYRFGIYASQEAYGIFTTPIIGWYYLSPDKKFQMDMNLPINGDITYNFGFVNLGIDYVGIGRSYVVRSKKTSEYYIDHSSLEFSSYLQIPVQGSFLLRTKIGYSTNDFKAYATDETIDLGISAIKIGDARTQLNQDLKGSFFFKLEWIYRFDISKAENRR